MRWTAAGLFWLVYFRLYLAVRRNIALAKWCRKERARRRRYLAAVNKPSCPIIDQSIGRSEIVAALTVFAVGIAYWPDILSAGLAPRWSAAALGLAALMWVMPQPRLPIWLVIGLSYAALSLSWSPDPLGGFDDLCHLALFALAFLAGMALSDLAPVFIGASLACFVMLPWVAIQIGTSSTDDAVGLFLNRDSLARFSVLAALGALYGGRSWLAWPGLVCLAASHSTGGVAALLCGILRRHWTEAPRAIVAVTTILLTIAIIIAVSVPGLYADSIAVRFEIWRAAISGLSVFGAGFGGFAARFPGYEFAHNDFLQLVYDLGIGAMPFGILAVLAWRGCGTPAERAVFAGFMAEAMIGYPLYSPATMLVGALVAGRLVARPRPLCIAADVGGNSDGRRLSWRPGRSCGAARPIEPGFEDLAL